jgi:hypothetical protein
VNACPHDAAHRVDAVGLYLAAEGQLPLREAARRSVIGFAGVSLHAAVRAASAEGSP